MSSTIPEEVLKKIIEEANARHPILSEEYFDDSFMDYDEYKEEQKLGRAKFVGGAKFGYSLRPEVGSDVASDNNTSQASVASHSFTDNNSIGHFLQFTEWVGGIYVRCAGGWIPRYSNQIKARVRTTEELYKRYKMSEPLFPTAPTQSSEEETQEDLWKEAAEDVFRETSVPIERIWETIDILEKHYTIQRKSK